APELAGISLELGHGLDDVRHAVGVYATRLHRARAAVAARAPAPPPDWLPPDVSHLLPSGPVVLRHETITCDPQPDDTHGDAQAGAGGGGAHVTDAISEPE